MSVAVTPLKIQENVPLSDFSTIGLGGNARYFFICKTVEDILEALAYSHKRDLRVHILGGGSNVIFADAGFDGLVIKVDTKGIAFEDRGTVAAAAGEPWDQLVVRCIERGLGGMECLSGIPGLVGATPIQNVGAYGQEVADTIVSLRAIDRKTLDEVEFTNRDCRFAYRQSRFKSQDADRYVITKVTFQLREGGRPVITYPELSRFMASTTGLDTLHKGEPALSAVREAVLALRRKKSMVLDLGDPNSRSVGSFFTNPIISIDRFDEVHAQWSRSGHDDRIPTFPSGDEVKIPAAWLVEKAGFAKGYRIGNVGVSHNHSLALVNHGGSTSELLELAARIQRAVYERFGISLEREPVVIPA